MTGLMTSVSYIMDDPRSITRLMISVSLSILSVLGVVTVHAAECGH